jgi:site-specific recombinase XerD
VKRLIRATTNKRDRALVELFYSSGCRNSELATVRIEQIDFRRRAFPVKGKRKERLVYFGKPALKAIRDYMNKRKNGYLFQDVLPDQKGYLTRSAAAWHGCWRDHHVSIGEPKSKRCIHLGTPGTMSLGQAKRKFDRIRKKLDLGRPKPDRPLHKSTIGKIVVEVGRRAGLGVVTPKMLRHSFATHLLERGADICVIRDLLGHSYLTSTQIYARVSNTRVAASYKRFHPRAA